MVEFITKLKVLSVSYHSVIFAALLMVCFFFYGAQKPAAKVAVPSKNQSAKNGTLSTPAEKGKPAASSSSSESSDDNSDEDEVSKTPFITLIIVKISRSIRGVQYSQCLVFNFFYCFQAPKPRWPLLQAKMDMLLQRKLSQVKVLTVIALILIAALMKAK